MDLQIIDNFLSFEEQNLLETVLLGGYFPWHYLSTSAYEEGFLIPPNFYHNSIDTPFFSHIVYNDNKINSNFWDFAKIITDKIPNIENYKLERYKINLTMSDSRCNSETHSFPHTDLNYDSDYTTCIYYVNDSSGDTFIYNQRDWSTDELTIAHRITPKRGRFIMFDGHHLHSGNNPLDFKARVVANINLIPKSN